MSEHVTREETIQLLDAENEPIENSAVQVAVTNVIDGIMVRLNDAVFIVERTNTNITRLFVITQDGDDETVTVEIDDKDDDDRKLKVFSAGGKVLFDSEQDNRYARE